MTLNPQYVDFWLTIMLPFVAMCAVGILSFVTITVSAVRICRHLRSMSRFLNYLAYTVSQENGDNIVRPFK